MGEQVHHWIGSTLDTLLLTGILITALVTIFRAGRWFQGLMASVDHMSDRLDRHSSSIETLHRTLEEHVTEETTRFEDIERKIDLICTQTNGSGQ